jgi:hypothetical protein
MKYKSTIVMFRLSTKSRHVPQIHKVFVATDILTLFDNIWQSLNYNIWNIKF